MQNHVQNESFEFCECCQGTVETNAYLLHYILMKLAKCSTLYELLCDQAGVKREKIFLNKWMRGKTFNV